MKEGSIQGRSIPRSCAAAITSVAASSTTLNPSSSNWRIIAVFPAPGAPVRMNLFMFMFRRCPTLPLRQGGNSLGDFLAVEAAVFDENLVSVHTCHQHSRQIHALAV